MSKLIDATLKLIDNFTAPLDRAAINMSAKTRMIKRNSYQIRDAGKTMSSIGKGLTKGLTVPILGILTASGKLAADFDTNMGQINTLLDDKSHFEGYRNAAINSSNETGLSLDTTTKGLYQAISSIGDGGKKTEKIFGTMAKAAKAGGSEVKDSVSLISAGMKAYNSINDKTAKQISDMAFQTQKLGSTTFPEMATSMQKVFPSASSLNMSLGDVFGSFATLTGVTGDTNEVSTQMKGIMTGLMKPTSAMSSLMKKYGYESGESMIKAKGFGGVLKILKKETGGSSTEMGKLFGNSRALTAMLALTGNQYDTFVEKTKKVKGSTGATDKAMKDMQTSMSRLKKVVNVAKNSLTIFGSAALKVVVPAAEKLANKLKKLSKSFAKMPEEQQKSIVKLGLFVASIGPVLTVGGTLLRTVGNIGLAFSGVIKAISEAGGIIPLITSPAGIAIGVFAALVVAGVLIYKNWDKLKKAGKALANMVKKIAKAMGFDFGAMGKRLRETASSIVKNWKQMLNAVKNCKPFQAVVSFLKSVFGIAFKVVFSKIVGYLSSWVKTIGDMIHGIMTVFDGIITFITGVFSGNWGKAWEGIKKIFSGVFEGLTAIAKRPINQIIGMVNGVISGLNKIKLPEWVPKIGGKGINLPKLPMLYNGTSNWGGGPAVINEKAYGGEIVDLPSGSRVYPHDKSVQMAKNAGSRSIVINIPKLAEQIVIRGQEDIDALTSALAEKLEKTAYNMA